MFTQTLLLVLDLLLATAAGALGQTKSLASLPAYDCSLRKVMVFLGQPVMLISPDDAQGLDGLLQEYRSTLGAQCVVKREAELLRADYAGRLFVVGELARFRHWEKLGVPVRKLAEGFALNGRTFRDPAAGVAYVGDTRILLSGNSLRGLKDAQLALTGGHDVLLTERGQITYFGNYQNGQLNWYNLQQFKPANYRQVKSRYFATIYVSKTFAEKVDFRQVETELKTYTQQFLAVYSAFKAGWQNHLAFVYQPAGVWYAGRHVWPDLPRQQLGGL